MTVVRDLSSAGAAASKGRMPALFVSHGSPMFAVQPGLVGPQLHALGQAPAATPGGAGAFPTLDDP